MADVLIYPNWHVLLVHFPLALLITGVIVELLSLGRPNSTARVAGRWMILLGALAAIPTITTGVYAFNDVARAASKAQGMAAWSDVTANSTWKPQQWNLMRWHILLTCGGTALCVIAAIGYLAACERRRGIFGPVLLILVLIGLGGVSAGAWFSGEAVYRHGVGMAPAQTPAAESAAASTIKIPSTAERVKELLPPLQSHLALVGLTVALAVAGIGLTLHRWGFERRPEPLPPIDPARPPATSVVPAVRPGHAAGVWLLACLAAVATAAAGIWESFDWQLSGLRTLLSQAISSTGRKNLGPDQLHMVWHFAMGASIIILSLLLAAITRWLRGGHVFKGILMILLLLVVAGQVYLGVRMLYGL